MKIQALFIVTGLVLMGCSGDNHKTEFRNCEDIQNYTRIMASRAYSDLEPVSANSASGTELPNPQEKGVDESDTVRIGKYQIFVSHQDGVEVVQRNTLKKLGVLETGSLSRVRLFTDDKKVVLFGARYGGKFEVRWYRARSHALPDLIRTDVHTGYYVDSRYVNDRLVLILKDDNSIQPDGTVQLDSPEVVCGIPCNRLAYPQFQNKDFQITKVLSLEENGSVKAIGFLGGGNQIYMTLESLYLTSRDINSWWLSSSETAVTKVDYEKTTGDLHLAAAGKIPGYIKDRWALKEYPNDLLSVITTSGWDATNRLYVLKENMGALNRVASSPEFGHHEDIRAVRYVGSMAYAVTFKKTDPLFAIDMTDPMHPKMKGELVVPGFSAYLHPFRENLLVGVGLDARDMGSFAWFQGIQVSLFDVSDPLKLKQLDVHVSGLRGSYAEPISDSHAFYSDPDRSRIGVPLVELTGNVVNEWDFGSEVKFSGAILYQVGATLNEVSRLSHNKYIPKACKTQMAYGRWWQSDARSYDINHLQNVDGKLLSISRFAIQAHCLENPSQVTDIVLFSSTAEESGCQ
jgi:uncharacterized secreted protein with C-terminal beta-propeller domain